MHLQVCGFVAVSVNNLFAFDCFPLFSIDMDDLDALLDDAVETLKAQDTDIERERQVSEKAAEDLLNSALGDNTSEDPLMKALGELMGVLGKGPDSLQSESEVKRIEALLASTLSAVEGAGELTCEDKASLENCKNLIGKLQHDDAGSEKDREEMAAAIERDFQKLSAGVAGTAGYQKSEVPEGDLSEMFANMLSPEVLRDPFIALRDAFGPWLVENGDALPTDDRTRFEQQYRLAGEISNLMESEGLIEALQRQMSGEEEADDTTKNLLDRFTDLVSELQALGSPPESLFKKD